jgi:hypothetical protein
VIGRDAEQHFIPNRNVPGSIIVALPGEWSLGPEHVSEPILISRPLCGRARVVNKPLLQPIALGESETATAVAYKGLLIDAVLRESGGHGIIPVRITPRIRIPDREKQAWVHLEIQARAKLVLLPAGNNVRSPPLRIEMNTPSA